MSDIGSIEKDTPIHGTPARPRTGAYVEQWQRELEAACQRYVSAARSTGPEEPKAAPPQAIIKERIADVANRPAGVPPQAASSLADSGTGAAPGARPGASPVAGARAGGAVRQDATPVLVPAIAPRSGSVPPGRASAPPGRAGGLPEAARCLLPDASSVRLLRAGGYLHLVVRDSALEPTALLRLASRIRAALGATGGRLAAITLNGERIWQLDSEDPVFPAAAFERAVDRHY